MGDGQWYDEREYNTPEARKKREEYNKERERAIEAEKKDICDFVKRLNDDTINSLNKFKQKKYKEYELNSNTAFAKIKDRLDKKSMIENDIKDIKEKLNSRISTFFISENTIKELKKTLEDLTSKLEPLNSDLEKYQTIYDTMKFVEQLRLKYYNEKNTHPNNGLDTIDFFSYLVNCETIVHTTAEYATTDAVVVDTNTNTNDVALAEATRIHNKYLKYKQKYLNLKNKIN